MSDLETYSHKLLPSNFASPGQARNPKEVGEMGSCVGPSLTGLRAGRGTFSVPPSPPTSSLHPLAQRTSHSYTLLAAAPPPKDLTHLRLRAQGPHPHRIIPHRGEPPSVFPGSRKPSLHCPETPWLHAALVHGEGLTSLRVTPEGGRTFLQPERLLRAFPGGWSTSRHFPPGPSDHPSSAAPYPGAPGLWDLEVLPPYLAQLQTEVQPGDQQDWPAPPDAVGLTPKPSSRSLLARSPAPIDIHRPVCTRAHACMHAARIKVRPLTDTSASPPPPGGLRCHRPTSQRGGGEVGPLRGPPCCTGSPPLLCTAGVRQQPRSGVQ
uniref:Uncharacterized protein n=1 Tax=Rangifer tarandus platyrhynchus TaxID=3082113 RepID=A0ACB0DPQ5_RANTA|nr:unnamed protein product [Rangifer tarandus platyrhynchus]